MTGTWIPPERGLELARLYNCDLLLKPIIEFVAEPTSPPLAPKHVIASAPPRPPVRKETSQPRSSLRHTQGDASSLVGSEDEDGESEAAESSVSSVTPPPVQNTSSYRLFDVGHDGFDQYSPGNRGYDRPSESEDEASSGPNYTEHLLEYFVSDSSQIPQFLIERPKDFDPNAAIDEEGHTALHWASAMGRMRVVKLLLSAGADIFKVNKAGQTALMRSVMFSNNYDVRKFPELYELLHRSTLNIDNFNRTVFHHIMQIAMSKQKTHAARYYMETILQRLSEYPKELADIINFQDEDGETALTLAARCRSKRLVKLLIDHGADPKIANRDGKTTEDYILEDERFRSSPSLPSRTSGMSFRTLRAANASASGQGSLSNITYGERLSLHHSVTAQAASTQCVNDMAVMLESLAASFDQELKDKEHDMTQAQLVLHTIQSEILEHRRTVNQLQQQCEGLDEAKENLGRSHTDLISTMTKRSRIGYEKWLRDEEGRERQVRALTIGKDLPFIPGVLPDVVPNGLVDGNAGSAKITDNDVSDLRALYEDLPTDELEIKKACQTLRTELEESRATKTRLVEELATLHAEAGTGSRMAQYRRLISSGCGGMALSEVDDNLTTLLEVSKIQSHPFKPN